MVASGWLPMPDGVDPDSLSGPPELIEAIDFFCQHGTLDGWERLEALSDHSSDDEVDASELPSNRPRVTARNVDSMKERYRKVHDDDADRSREGSLLGSGSSGTISTIPTSPETSYRSSLPKSVITPCEATVPPPAPPRPTFPAITNLTIEMPSVGLGWWVNRQRYCSIDQLQTSLVQALKGKEGHASVRLPLPCYSSIVDDGYHEYISLPNLKTATFPSGKFWPAVFLAPKLETVRFTTPHSASGRQRIHIGPPLLNGVALTDRNRAKLLQIRHLELDCCSNDDQRRLSAGLSYMRNLKTLRVRCVHTHKDQYSGLSYEPGNADKVLSGLVDSLKAPFTDTLEAVYMEGMFFEPGDLIDMVETRKRRRGPLKTLHVKCPPLPATECAVLHKMLNFRHVRNEEETPPLQQTPCECSCEAAPKKVDKNDLADLSTMCTIC